MSREEIKQFSAPNAASVSNCVFFEKTENNSTSEYVNTEPRRLIIVYCQMTSPHVLPLTLLDSDIRRNMSKFAAAKYIWQQM